MASSARQNKTQRKGGQDNSRRPAWSGPRASPTFAPASSSPRPQGIPPSAMHPPAQSNGARTDPARDRVLQSLAGLTGTTVTLITKTGVRHEGVVGSTTGEGDTTGVTLKDVKDLATPGAPLKDSVFIAATNIESYTSGPADAKPANGDTFRTDTDISQKKANAGRERELQAWKPDNDAPPMSTGDDETFGTVGSNTSWDQFAVNEKLFGVTGGFVEDEYTTKIDRSGVDFKERERKAQRIANEILGTTTNNPHVLEERGVSVDDSGLNEEDKYGAVVRGQNAYVPPGARRSGAAGALSPPSTVLSFIPATNNINSESTSISAANSKDKQEVPKVSVNGPDGNASQVPLEKAPSPAPGGPKDAPAAFREFVAGERERLARKRQAIFKNDMDKRIADLKKFSKTFKLNKPIPDDLVPILAKDEEKQRQITEKAKKDAESNQARTIGASTAATASRGIGVTALKAGIKPPAGIPKPTLSQTPSSSQKPGGPTTSKSETAVKKIPMVIQSIPPFKGSKAKQPSPPTTSSATGSVNGANSTTVTTAASPTPMSPTSSSANRLNVNASSFRPGPKVAPSASSVHSISSPKPKSETVSTIATPNPFFGVRPIKKSSVTHVKDDFNPFKNNKPMEPNSISPQWQYHGKRYGLMFPLIPHPPPHHPQHGPPVPPPMPPPPYEDDQNAQVAARGGYVYAYPPYGYPGQPMMPGMAPAGPPGAYMQGPFIPHMPYPPSMPPPAMYSPAMGQMQPYMGPPPGAYPPPPNGGGHRPSMPPTPIPAHAHPYYHHQSPQLQHASPYPMMMAPPGGVPPHPYENGPPPPVQMGGHA